MARLIIAAVRLMLTLCQSISAFLGGRTNAVEFVLLTGTILFRMIPGRERSALLEEGETGMSYVDTIERFEGAGISGTELQ